tara:strand:- start:887 stop:1153 length:267 start_codon:yes stop_codon:yes gene_type:complete
MSKMSDLDVELNQIKKDIEEMQTVCHALLGVLLQLVTLIGDTAHDQSFNSSRLMHAMGAIRDNLTLDPDAETSEEGTDDNVVPLFDED